MEHLFSSSVIDSPIGYNQNCKKSLHSSNPINTYMVEITDFDNEIHYLEIDAKDYNSASSKASRIFKGSIYQMNIYQF